MEDIHGIDVSWLHHSNREHHRQHAPSSPAIPREALPNTLPPNGSSTYEHTESPRTEPARPAERQQLSTPPSITIPPSAKTPSKRPALLGRSSAEKVPTSPHAESKSLSRRNSWISSISSKFSLPQSSPAQLPNSPGPHSTGPTTGLQSTTSSTNTTANGQFSTSGNPEKGLEGHVPQPAKPSFLSNALRRLSSGTQVGTLGKTIPNGGLCPRRVMNVDPHRPRCLVPELDQNKLRRVAFCVDVEIASGPRYKDDLDNEEKKTKRKEKKLKERGEGEALKHPDLVAEEKDADGVIRVSSVQEAVGTEEAPNPEGTVLDGEKKEPTKKKEKKKKSEAERKERKEKRRRKAEENGSIPLELTREDDDDDASPDRNPAPTKVPSSRQDRPTTDPLRIYRRCCQLREAPILKRICDQLSAPVSRLVGEPGVVTCLDLAGSRLQLSDIVTLGDWLAVVPVKKLILEDADLTDEKVRVILAGLLAAKVQEAPRRPRTSQDKTSVNGENQFEERTGCVEKLCLKNNPKITREGWKHICLFLYMCKSIKGIDVSMIPFPEALHQVASNSNGTAPPKPSTSADIAETLCKALSERLGGSRLEELVMAECSLKSQSIRKIVDGAVMSGVQRLGLAGNDIDEEGLGYVIHYIRSGVCQGLDLGGNDLSEGIGRLADGLTKDCPLWALCLADCDLTADLLRPLFGALVSLPNFRFLDLSHNRDLFSNSRALCLLRKYIPQLPDLKRLHLTDVSMTPAQAIGLAEVLPECPQLAHINILENPQISALSVATDEATQEEAAALYASFMAAARVSRTLICVDVDVPSPEQNEVVKALAKQVVAYCLRNMETITEIPELKEAQKEVEIPGVLLNLVGNTEGYSVNRDHSEPPPDDDYIVGGTGVVKALRYCLLQKASDSRRTSLPASGTVTPRVENENENVKAKTMSTNLLETARNIRSRLQPALVREAQSGNDFAHRRLVFLDQTLQGMIRRFEDEFPETRLPPPDAVSMTSSQLSASSPTSASQILSASATDTERTWTTSGDFSDDDEPKGLCSRHNSDVSLASRVLSLEEGRIHRLGHRVRTEILNASEPTVPTDSHPTDTNAASSHSKSSSIPTSDSHPDADADARLLALRSKLDSYSGEELRHISQQLGPEEAFQRISDDAAELKRLVTENSGDFERFKASQIAALRNRRLDGGNNGGGGEGEKGDEFAVQD